MTKPRCQLKPSAVSTVDVSDVEQRCVAAMDDDLNSPMVISALFDWVRIINQLVDGSQTITAADLETLTAGKQPPVLLPQILTPDILKTQLQ